MSDEFTKRLDSELTSHERGIAYQKAEEARRIRDAEARQTALRERLQNFVETFVSPRMIALMTRVGGSDFAVRHSSAAGFDCYFNVVEGGKSRTVGIQVSNEQGRFWAKINASAPSEIAAGIDPNTPDIRNWFERTIIDLGKEIITQRN